MKTNEQLERKRHKKGVGRFEKIKELGKPKEGKNCYISPDLNQDGSNNPAWHCVNDTVGENAGRISFAQPMGFAMELNQSTLPGVAGETTVTKVAGIMVNRYIPTFGSAIYPDDAMNVAAKEMFNEVRKMNTSTPPYDRNNLMMAQIAISEAFTLIVEAVRALAMRNLYGVENRFVGQSLITALGYDYNDLTVNKADWVSAINLAILKIQSLPIPNTMAYALRQMWMNGNVFMDENIAKSQLYLFVRDGYYKYEGYKAQGGSVLTFVPRSCKLNNPGRAEWDLQTWTNYFSKLTANLFDDEDVAKMTSEILKRFEGNLLSLSQITEEYVIMPVHDEDALLQIHNSIALTDGLQASTVEEHLISNAGEASFGIRFFPRAVSPGTTYVGNLNGSGDQDIIKYPEILSTYTGKPEYSTLDVVESGRFCKQFVFNDVDVSDYPLQRDKFGSKIINTYEDKPSWQRVLEMTRLIPTTRTGVFGYYTSDPTDKTTDYGVLFQGLDLITHRYVIVDQITDSDMNEFMYTPFADNPNPKIYPISGTIAIDDQAGLASAAYCKQFNYSPLLRIFMTSSEFVLLGDLNNYTVLPLRNIEMLNRVDALALLIYRTGLPK